MSSGRSFSITSLQGTLQHTYEGGRVEADRFVPARWELLPKGRYMWGSVQTVRGCPKHCSFCSVWRTDGQRPRQRGVDSVVAEIVELRRHGFRFVALADDNFYPVTLADLAMAERQRNAARLEQLRALRAERFELMARLAELPSDMVFFTQITMEAAEDEAFLDAMRRANIKGALVGVEAVTPEGLKDVYKDFNDVGEALVQRLRKFRDHGVHVLGSFIFGLPSDRPATFEATADVAERAGLAFAQFVMLTPYPGTVDFEAWEKSVGAEAARVAGIPITRHWLIPQAQRPKVYAPHPVMTRRRNPRREPRRSGIGFIAFDGFGRGPAALRPCAHAWRSSCISKLYRQMYANTGIATDSARVSRANALGSPDRATMSPPLCCAADAGARERSVQGVTRAKDGCQRGWFAQHQRLIEAIAAQKKRPPLIVQ